MDGRLNITEINEEERTVYFEPWKLKKISGTKIGAIFGLSPFSSPFKVACELAFLYPGDPPNRYIDAGNILEPVLRNYLGRSVTRFLSDKLNVPEGSKIAVELPVEKEDCGYDHFHDNKRFGGLVDGYIMTDGKRSAILEIKTASSKEKWTDENGELTRVPPDYLMQASLYAELSHLDDIVFLVGFLEEADYERPTKWNPDENNTLILVVKKQSDIKEKMAEAEKWYDEYVKQGYTPEWTDSDIDKNTLAYVKKKPQQPKRSGGRR